MVSAKDIAAALNISPATVSMVFNNRPGVKEETRTRVIETARAMGYVPHTKGRSGSRSLTLLVCDTKAPSLLEDVSFFDQIVNGLAAKAQEAGFTLQVRQVNTQSPEDIAAIADQESSGVILFAKTDGPIDPSIIYGINLPMMILANPCETYSVDSVSINNIQGIHLAVEHLYNLGHRDIAFLIHDSAYPFAGNYYERYLGFIGAVSLHPETAHCRANVIRWNSNDSKSREQLTKTLEKLENMPTAIVCPSDWHASYCMSSLHDLGLSVPGDVSVTGFDNLPLVEAVSPALTTVSVPTFDMSAHAISRLVSLINNKEKTPVKTEVFTTLIERESTGVPRTAVL